MSVCSYFLCLSFALLVRSGFEVVYVCMKSKLISLALYRKFQNMGTGASEASGGPLENMTF